MYSMVGGKTIGLLNVDRKGRLHLPLSLREEMGMNDQVVAETEGDVLLLKPLKKIGDPIQFLLSLQIKTKKTPLEMKREAEAVFG